VRILESVLSLKKSCVGGGLWQRGKMERGNVRFGGKAQNGERLFRVKMTGEYCLGEGSGGAMSVSALSGANKSFGRRK